MMKRWVVIPMLGLAASNASAALITISDTAPAIGPDDVAQPQFNAPGTWDANGNDFPNGPTVGQSFVTPGVSAGGYMIGAVTVKGVGTGAAAAGGSFSTGPWHIRISEVVGNVLVSLDEETVADATAMADDGQFTYYVTFHLENGPTLLPATTYAFDLYNEKGYFGLAASPNVDPYPGGMAFNSGAAQS